MPEYTILPFQFKSFGNECLLVNEAGDHVFLGKEDFERFTRHQLSVESPACHMLKSHLMLAGEEVDISLRKLAARYRTRASDDIFMSPLEYMRELAQAARLARRYGLPVSIYNIPLCLCPEDARPYARQSISSWKNFYPETCDACGSKHECAGFFTTSTNDALPLDSLKPFSKEARCEN